MSDIDESRTKQNIVKIGSKVGELIAVAAKSKSTANYRVPLVFSASLHTLTPPGEGSTFFFFLVDPSPGEGLDVVHYRAGNIQPALVTALYYVAQVLSPICHIITTQYVING